MPKRPKVDSQAVNQFFAEPEQPPPKPEPKAKAEPPVKATGDLANQIVELKNMVGKLEALMEPVEFNKLTCKNLK